jgi:hypothetical protein
LSRDEIPFAVKALSLLCHAGTSYSQMVGDCTPLRIRLEEVAQGN